MCHPVVSFAFYPGNSSALLTWLPPSLDRKYSFQVRYWRSGTPVLNSPLLNFTTNYTAADLLPGLGYNVSILAMALVQFNIDAQACDVRNSAVFNFSSKVIAPSRSLMIVSAAPQLNAVVVSLSFPDYQYLGGPITALLFKLQRLPGQARSNPLFTDTAISMSIPIGSVAAATGNLSECVVLLREVDILYNMSVALVNSAGVGPSTDYIVAHSAPSGLHSIPFSFFARFFSAFRLCDFAVVDGQVVLSSSCHSLQNRRLHHPTSYLTLPTIHSHGSPLQSMP